MRIRPRPIVAASLALTSLAAYALSALPSFWTLESQADFLEGEVEGLSISSDGTLSLSPVTQSLYEATDPFFWSLVSDSQGNLYAGSGNEGKIHKVEPSGRTTVVLDTNELEVHCLAVDREGNLYAGTSPQGRVYRLDRDGKQEIFFDPDDKYIWALAFDGAGNLLVASGEKGNLYRVNRSGQSEVLFASQETHLLALALDNQGNIFAGSDPNGLVFKIDPSGKGSVVFDSPFREVHAIVLDPRGNVYAAAINGESGTAPARPRGAPPVSTPSLPETAPPQPVIESAESVMVTAAAAPLLTSPRPPAGTADSLRGGLYRISPEGATEMLWSSREDVPLSLKLERDDRLMLGTGKEGRVFLVRQDKTSSLLLRAEADQVTSIHSLDNRTLYFATSNPAKIYRLRAERRTEGFYRSPIKDTSTVSSWGKMRWEGRVPRGAGLVIQTRSGNSARPDNTWSDWSPPYTVPEGDQILSPRGRFLIWRATLKSASGESSPELLSVTAVYLQQNLRPEVTEITVHPPGETFQKPLLTAGQVEVLGLDVPLASSETNPTGGLAAGGAVSSPTANLPFTAYSKKIYNKGYQTVSWSASDPNDDTLTYEVHYRAEGESLWKLLRKDLSEPIIAWDTVAMPDGRYTLKIVASDAAGNPADAALAGEKEGRSFEIDNTPPRVSELKVAASTGGHRVSFLALDDSSAVRKVEYALDSGRWMMVYPKDGICDSKREEFDFALSGSAGGVHTLVVKVTDLLGNVGTARSELR